MFFSSFFPPPFYTICTVFYHTVRSFFLETHLTARLSCGHTQRTRDAAKLITRKREGDHIAADSTETTGNVSSLKCVRVQKYCLTHTALLLSGTSGQARQGVEKGRFMEVFLWFRPGVGFLGGWN